MSKLKITKAETWNWYKVDQEFEIVDSEKYSVGIQVKVDGNSGVTPDIVQHGHYQLI